jgi:ABC-type branched-subunit amino acid transport system permease subunit
MEREVQMMLAAEIIVALMGAYTVVGVLFAMAFVTIGIERIDPVAKGATAGFRLIVFPGVALLWPLLMSRWIASRRQQ